MGDRTLEQRYTNLKQKVMVRKGDFGAFINMLETKTNWLTSPASTRYHLNEEGGLLKHSVGVAENLLKFRDFLAPEIAEESCIIVGLFHDVGKIGMPGKPLYIKNDNEWEVRNRNITYKTNPDIAYISLAARSLYLVSKYIPLSDAEAQAILYHDGQYIDDNRCIAHREEPLTLLTHWADYWTAHIYEEGRSLESETNYYQQGLSTFKVTLETCLNFQEFSQIIKTELPLNRKEKFYTATVLPALLFNDGMRNLYCFLRSIKDFPPDVNENMTGENLLFYTEYNLRESAGDRNIGRKIEANGKDTPDLIVEILEPRLFVVIEGKMFERVNQSKINGQIRRQRENVIEPIKREFGLEDKDIYHIVLVPKASGIKGTESYQVINWEFFIDNDDLNISNCHFYNYLKAALDNYGNLVSISQPPTTVEDYKTGEEIYKNGKSNGTWWIGADKIRSTIIEHVKTNCWREKTYCMNTNRPVGGRKGNWITSKEFAEIIDRYSSEN